jgi:ABC-2 type transport system ATP-binding protein
MLEIKNFSKQYKNSKVNAVKNLSIKINAGEVFGFLGKNGAGKSTTIKSIMGILPFNEGTIFVNGRNIMEEELYVKSIIGYVPDNHAIFDRLTGREYVNFMADIFKVDQQTRDERIEMFLEMFDLKDAIDNQISSYSHGMRQKVSIMGAVIHSPKLLILDEPMTGLDPQSINKFRTFLKNYARLGNTVFFSSHDIGLVSKVCNRVGIIEKGKLLNVFEIKGFRKNYNMSLEKMFLQITAKQASNGAE